MSYAKFAKRSTVTSATSWNTSENKNRATAIPEGTAMTQNEKRQDDEGFYFPTTPGFYYKNS